MNKILIFCFELKLENSELTESGATNYDYLSRLLTNRINRCASFGLASYVCKLIKHKDATLRIKRDALKLAVNVCMMAILPRRIVFMNIL